MPTKMTHETLFIKISQLEVNTENARFEMVGNQREAINVMIDDQKDKLVKLARNIIANGANPSDLVIVTPSEMNDKKYKVLEGNRRVTTLKLLSNPTLIQEKHKSILNKFKQLSEEFKRDPTKELNCVVFDDEDDAAKWVKLKHTGENEGVGTVGWDTQQKERFEVQHGANPSYALQVLDSISKDASFSAKLKKQLPKIASTNLQRLLSDPDIRTAIGLDVNSAKITSRYPLDEIRKPLTRIITDLLRDDFGVKDIYYKDDRENYIETFKKTDLPDKTKGINPWEINTPNPPKTSKKQKREKSPLINRNSIIPKDCIIHINQPKTNRIYRELKDLNSKDFVNAAAVLFRVFVELSIDEYIDKNKLKGKAQEKLASKIQKVTTHMKDNKLIERDKIKAVNTVVSSPNSILSINTYNAYVHNKHFTPIAGDLKTTWDNLEPFISKLWELI